MRPTALAGEPSPRRLARTVALAFAVSVVAAVGAAAVAGRWLTSPWASLAVAVAVGLAVGFALLGRWLRPAQRALAALRDGLRSFRDGDFSTRLASGRRDEVGELFDFYNGVADTLSAERAALAQRELLLATVLQSTPMALVLTDSRDRIVLANRAARDTFATAGRPEGQHFGRILADCPKEMQEVLAQGHDALFTVEQGGEDETYHLARRRFELHGQPHTLTMLRRLTQELRRQEVAVWKQAIRMMSHELNNSLAPITSLTRSARRILEDPEHAHRLDGMLATIAERAEHLRDFLERYARLARLPAPRKEAVEWGPFLAELTALCPFARVSEPPPFAGFFDPSQVQQVLINLHKNAVEAGSPPAEITLALDGLAGGGVRLAVRDRGKGMSAEELRRALLPLYSSKPGGSGLGLPLCREIAEGHGGRLRIQSREGGGVAVQIWLPGAG